MVKGKIHGESANPSFFLPYDDIEPKVLVSMPIVENPASHAHGHAWGKEIITGQHGDPIVLLPSVFRLVVLEAKPFEGKLQQPRSCKKEKDLEVHFFQMSLADCFMTTSTEETLILYSYLPSDWFIVAAVFTPFCRRH